ncbi:site-specific integrase, partial [bacterium]
PDQGAAAVIKFALYTGLRRGEIFKLEWSNVDVDRKIITLRNPKGGTDQNLPISKEAAEVIKALPKSNSLWVFPSSKTGGKRKCIRGAWAEIRKAANLPSNFRFHGLHHHFASALVSGGIDLYVVQKLLTHKDAATTQRYAHLSDNALRKAVDISAEILRPKSKTEKIINFFK